MLEVLALNGGVLAMDGEELATNVISLSLLELLITAKNYILLQYMPHFWQHQSRRSSQEMLLNM